MIGESLLRLAVTVNSTSYETGLPKVSGNGQIGVAIQVAIAILAALSVLMIVIAGFRFIVGQGNPQEIAKARSTIVYAIVGLLVAFMAQALLTLALDKL